jgi:2-oxoglutarate ferredoxin oxidoreductase subunit alpha
VEITALARGPLVPNDWAVDGSRGGTGRSRNVNSLGMTKGQKGIDPERFWKRLQAKHDEIARTEARCESEGCDAAEIVVVAFGTLARFARYVARELRREGIRVGYFRPITLWPFPNDALAQATRDVRRVAVLEQNAGQMIDDVRLSVLGRAPVVAIGGISSDPSGFGIGPLLNTDNIRERIACALEGREVCP